MKKVTKILMAAIVAVGLTACGSGNNTTQQGALNGAGIYGPNGQNLAAGGCQALSGPLTFAASGAYVDTMRLIFGNFSGQSYGTVAMNAPSIVGQIPFQEKQSTYGTLDLSLTATGQSATVTGRIQLTPAVIQYVMQYTNQMGTVVNGVLQNAGTPCVQSISMNAVQVIQQNSFNPYQYGNYGGTAYGPTCQGGCQGTVDSALVYLTLSTGQVFGPLQF